MKNIDTLLDGELENGKVTWKFFVDSYTMLYKVSIIHEINRWISQKRMLIPASIGIKYTIDSIAKGIETIIQTRFETESIELEKENLKEDLSVATMTLGEDVRYGLQHNETIPDSSYAIIQERFSTVINAYISKFTAMTDLEIVKNAPRYVYIRIILNSFKHLVLQTEFDLSILIFDGFRILTKKSFITACECPTFVLNRESLYLGMYSCFLFFASCFFLFLFFCFFLFLLLAS